MAINELLVITPFANLINIIKISREDIKGRYQGRLRAHYDWSSITAVMSNPELKITVLSIALAIGVTLLGSSALAATALERGLQEYKLKRYNAAARIFEAEIDRNPSNLRARLCLGRTLEMLRDPEGAKDEYKYCFSADPFGPDGKLARVYLLEVAERVAKKKHGPADGPKLVAQSIKWINSQSADCKSRHIARGDAAARHKNNMMNDQMRRQYNVHSVPDYNQNNRNRRYFGDGGDVSQAYWIQSSYLRTDYLRQAALARAEAAKRAFEVQKSANNLKMLLADAQAHPGQRGPKLRALGTNLYIRNYGEDREDLNLPVDPPIELRAKQMKFADDPRLKKELSAKNPKGSEPRL